MADPVVSDLDPQTTTIAQAQTWLNEHAKTSGGACCPACNKPARTYMRKVTPAQAAVLVLLYRTYPLNHVVHMPSFLASLSDPELAKTRDMSRLVFWDLIEVTDKEDYYRLGDGGLFFALHGHKITEKAWIKDEVVVGREGKVLSISEVLKDKFDINSLLSMPTPPTQTGETP